MVFQKRLDYGSSGYQLPAMPRVPKSAKGKRSARKKIDDNHACAFDLLATVAGKLLLQKENYSSSADLIGTSNPTMPNDVVKQGRLIEGGPLKPESFDQGSCDESTLGSEAIIESQVNYFLNEHSQTQKATASRHASVVAKSDVWDRGALGEDSIIYGRRDESKCSSGLVPKKCSTERHSLGSLSYEGKVDDRIKSALQTEKRKSGYVTDGHPLDKCSLDDTMDVDSRTLTFVSSDSSVEVPDFGDHIPCKSSFPRSRDDMELDVDRDDDENSSGCTHLSTLAPKVIRPQCLGDHKIRKLLTSEYRRVSPTFLKDRKLSNIDVETKPAFCGKKVCYTRKRTQRSSFKRRRVFEFCSISATEGGICSKGLSIPSGEDGFKAAASESSATLHEANGALSSTIDHKASCEPRDFHVKLSIKSFKVPELFIEMPETATVGSLKRTVMEAVTAMLGGGLHVGVLLQGKKVRDDSKTLLQAGISHNDKLDNLGFTLEPNPTQALTLPTSPEDPHFLLTCEASEPLTRIPAVPPTSKPGPCNHILQPPLTSVVNTAESDHDSVQSPMDVSLKSKTVTNSRALAVVPEMSVQMLAIVPLRKAKLAQLVQRRIRRPFSVSEVEALVQAVEKLGTGRWRDVKLRAFDNANHRTYVDLKDKWKTLVHTARISPQQRRGEPVPQELLDRVLSAHAYWSQRQAKLQVKPQQADACILV